MSSWLKKAFLLIIALVLLTELGALAPFVALKSKSFVASVLPKVLVALTNSERHDNDVSTLKTNSLLTEAAEQKANDMAERGYFSHTTPEGYTPWYWLDKVGYSYSHAGENLAVNFSDSKDVVDAWMHSPLHRANMVKETYTEIGIGVAEGEYEGKKAIFVAQFFGTPTETSSSQPAAISAEGASVYNAIFVSFPTNADTILLTILGIVVIILLVCVIMEVTVSHPHIVPSCGIIIVLILGLLSINYFFLHTEGRISSGDTTETAL